MTRLELSIFKGLMPEGEPMDGSYKTLWHKKIVAALDKLVAGVLNNKGVTPNVYQKMSVPRLLASLGRSNGNILAIGRARSFMINANTVHKGHFVGTVINYGYDSKLGHGHNWDRLRN